MGCKSTKVEGIPELSTLNDLPVEVLYKILDELDISTIFQSLYHVCKRFDKILSSYDEYHLNFKTISLKSFHLIASKIRPEQITQLTLSDDETSSGLIELFLAKYSLTTFVRLRSLTLIQINDEEILNQLLIPVADQSLLTNLSSIKIINDDEIYSDIFVELLMSILSKPSLRRAYMDLSYSRTTSNPLPWFEQCSIRHLTLIGTCTMSFLRNTFTYAPLLETLITDDFDFYDENDLNENVNELETDDSDDDDEQEDNDSEEVEIELDGNVNNNEDQLPQQEKFPPLESTNHIKSLTLNSCTFTMLKLQWLLKEIPTLKQLSLITTTGYDDESILDGQRWEALVSDIDQFKFVFSVGISDMSSWNIDTCIATFQKSFWIEKKQWFVSLEKYDDIVLLYTLPYIDKSYVMKTESSSFEYRSTAKKNSILEIQSMKNVHDLYIDTSDTMKPQLETFTLPRFSHVMHLILHGKWSKSKSYLTDLRRLVNLNTVEELTRNECIPTVDFIALLNLLPKLHSIRTNTSFLDALNAAKVCHTQCLREFTVDSSYDEDQRTVNIEPFCAMFPRIQRLTLPVSTVESCQYALEQLNQDLISVVFHIPADGNVDDSDDDDDDDDDDDEDNSAIDLFSEWIKQLPSRYRCHKKQNHIHISLK